jgi:hypothetical protein
MAESLTIDCLPVDILTREILPKIELAAGAYFISSQWMTWLTRYLTREYGPEACYECFVSAALHVSLRTGEWDTYSMTLRLMKSPALASRMKPLSGDDYSAGLPLFGDDYSAGLPLFGDDYSAGFTLRRQVWWELHDTPDEEATARTITTVFGPVTSLSSELLQLHVNLTLGFSPQVKVNKPIGLQLEEPVDITVEIQLAIPDEDSVPLAVPEGLDGPELPPPEFEEDDPEPELDLEDGDAVRAYIGAMLDESGFDAGDEAGLTVDMWRELRSSYNSKRSRGQTPWISVEDAKSACAADDIHELLKQCMVTSYLDCPSDDEDHWWRPRDAEGTRAAPRPGAP